MVRKEEVCFWRSCPAADRSTDITRCQPGVRQDDTPLAFYMNPVLSIGTTMKMIRIYKYHDTDLRTPRSRIPHTNQT
jgi:hypothetical protein